MKIKLRIKLIISYTFLSIFLIGMLFFISNYLIEKHFHQYIANKREIFNSEIVEDLSMILSQDNLMPIEFRSIVERLARERGTLSLETPTGEDLLKHIRQLKQNQEGRGKNRNQEGQWGIGKWQQPEYDIDKKIYPVFVNNKHIANAIISYPVDMGNEDEYFIEILNRFLSQVAIGAFLVAIAFGYYIAKIITKPLQQVIRQTAFIESGNYQNRISVKSDTKEINELIDSVNNLATTLEKQQQTQKRLARDYAHEIRTPLAAIQSNLEGMIDGVFDITEERLESCREEILRISLMIKDIDKIVEIDNQALVLNKESFDIAGLLQRTIKTFDKQILDKNINIIADISSISVLADKNKLGQVFINLLSNAIKYTQCGGEIRISLLKEKNAVKIRFEDNGIGISSKDLPHIFEHLYRADESRNRQTGGSGIGLAIVKGIIEAHRGTVSVVSVVDKGSIFEICLPV